LVFFEGLHATYLDIRQPAVNRSKCVRVERRTVFVGSIAEILKPNARELGFVIGQFIDELVKASRVVMRGPPFLNDNASGASNRG
jgi:hypothetical protein